MNPPPRTRSVAIWTLLLAVCLASAVAGRACYLGRPFDADAAMFVYMGRLVAAGGRVGPDLVDNKFPTVGLLTSGAWRAFGTSWPAYVGLGAAMSAVAVLAIAAAGGERGRLAAGLFAVVFLNLTPVVFGGFQLETPLACCAAVAAMAAVRAIDEDAPGAAFVAGLAAGCGALLKPTGVAVLAAMAVGIVVRQRARSGRDRATAGRLFEMAGSVLGGLAVPLGVAGIYLSSTGLWTQLPVTAHRLTAYAGGSVFDGVSWLKLATAGVLVGFPLWVRGVVGRPRPFRRVECLSLRQLGERPDRPGVTAFAWTWLVLEVIGVVAQRRMYAYHFLPIVPPAALVFGLLPRPTRPSQLLAALGPAAALGVVCALHVIATPGDGRLAVGQYLRARATPGDRVWADNWPRLLLETNLRPGARQPLTFLFADTDAAADADSRQIVADLTATRPAFVVLPADLPAWLHRQTSGIVELSHNPARAAAYTAGWHRIERYTSSHYRREATVGSDAVYRRADDLGVADVR